MNAELELLDGSRAALRGPLDLTTVGALLPRGSAAIEAGQVASMDLSQVEHSDSAGLALLIEWLSVASAASKPLAYANVPTQLRQLAQLSDVESLLTGEGTPSS